MINKLISGNSVATFEKIIENWRLKPNESIEQYPWKITDAMYKQNSEKVLDFFTWIFYIQKLL